MVIDQKDGPPGADGKNKTLKRVKTVETSSYEGVGAYALVISKKWSTYTAYNFTR